jgi:ligand-binding sensor protein
MTDRVSLSELVDVAELQDMQDSFSEVANVALRCVDSKGQFLTTISHPPALCVDTDHISFTNKNKISTMCLPSFLGGQGIVDEELSFECIPGLKHYLLPLKLAEDESHSVILGYLIVGPVVFMKRREKTDYAPIAEQLGIDLELLWHYILELRVFSYKGIQSLLGMIEQMMGRILNLAYAKHLMQKKMMKRSARRPSGVSVDPERLSEFLEIFLDLVLDISNGNRGSVMLLDPSQRSLVMRASHGIPDGSAAQACQKIGEGVAGLAAQMKRPFLINEDSSDALVTGLLHRPELFSSVVVPIKYRDDILGVVNVSSGRDLPVKFDESTLALVARAAGLAGVAIQRFQN